MPAEAFRIVLIEPPGFPHTAVFQDLARLLKLSLASLGHEVDVTLNRFASDRTNLVLGYHMLSNVDLLKDLRWIPYQLEQLDVHHNTRTPPWLEILSKAKEIWDYDPTNIAYLRRNNIDKMKHVPIGFHPGMQTILPQTRDIDVLHYGCMNARRKPVLTALHKKFLLKAVYGAYGAVRDDLISRSKIVLNFHQFDGALFEQVRVSHLLNNSACVVCEDSPYNPYADMLSTVPFDRLVDRCLELLADDPKRQQLAEKSSRRFAQMPMTDILSKAINP